MATAKTKETEKAISFPKAKVLTFERYAGRRDLLSALLEDGKEYTHDQIEKLIKEYLKGKVN